MVEFETIRAEEIKFGNKFVEVARKKAISDDGENEFISLSQGFFTHEGEKRYRKSVTLPLDPSVRAEIAEKLKDL